MAGKFGIDISHWQGDFDFAKAKEEGVEFVIIKCGGADRVLYKDDKFERNYKAAKEQGLGVGAYFFGYATTIEQAKIEANYCLSLLKGKQFDYPIFYDAEAEVMNKGKSLLTDIISAFCDYAESNGYWCGFYTNLDWYYNKLFGATLAQRYSLWLATWSKNMPDVKGIQMWQYGGDINYIRSNKVAGVVCDQNYCFVDYPSLIKARNLNGYKKQAVATKPQKTVDEIAQEVIQGKWGAGAERKKKITAAGFDYSAVQTKVNELMRK